MLSTNRGLIKYLLLSLITFGIYAIVVMTKISMEINVTASPRDHKHTTNYLWLIFILAWITFGIYPFIWYHKLSGRIGDELRARNIGYSFGAGSFWGWDILGSLIIIGPFVYLHKLFKSMNLINADYNAKLGA